MIRVERPSISSVDNLFAHADKHASDLVKEVFNYSNAEGYKHLVHGYVRTGAKNGDDFRDEVMMGLLIRN